MNITPQDILSSLFTPKDPVCFRVFDDKKGGNFPGAKFSRNCEDFSTIENQLRNHNAQDRGVFFVVNYGGHDDKSITRINAQFFEMDDGTFEEQLQKVCDFPLPPTIIIRTHRSLHVYYLMDDTAKVSRFRPIQKALAKHFGGDPKCVNESRVMRLPGFYHCKTSTPIEVTCTCFHPERRYTQDELEAALQGAASRHVDKISGTEKGLALVTESCDFIKYCRDNATALSEPMWYAMITNLAPFEGGAELIHELSAPYPGYTEDATQKKINHYFESNTRPITCKTIHESGYNCPKFAKGECPVKSPAALCYHPMPADKLVAALSNMHITTDPLQNLQSAKQFVTTYLYNQDTVTADTLIQSDLQRHFNLTPAAIKALSKYYKEARKEYNANKQTNEAAYNAEIPPWYTAARSGVKLMPGILAAYLTEEQDIIYAAESYYHYNDGVYSERSEKEIKSIVLSKLIPEDAKKVQIDDVTAQWQLQILKDKHLLNPNPFIINVRNGLYNVQKDTLEPHTPGYYSTIQLNVIYDKQADCPLFKSFLSEAMGGDADQVKLIQEILGYFLIPVTVAQKCFLLVGVATAGKSVLLRVINEVLLGKENVSNVSWQALNDRFKPAELFGKLANIFADLPTKNIEDNGIFKALVGEDYLTGEKKYAQPFHFQSTARLIFSCNSIPKNYGDRSEGFYRRLIILRFNHTIPQDKRDPNLLEKFREEANGIFQFALEGLRRLIENNYVFSETQVNIDELQQYREDSDSVLSFIKERCELDDSSAVGSTELYNAYKQYCDEGGMTPFAHKSFVQQITTTYPDVKRDVDGVARRRVLKGIQLGDILD